MNKEALYFRKELHIELLKELEQIKMVLNTSVTSIEIMKKFQKQKPFTIIPCVQNVGTIKRTLFVLWKL